MKIRVAIANFLAASACLWADPDVSITALSYDGNRVLCHVEVTHLEDLAITECQHAYLVVEAPTGKTWICNLGRITPQTESIGKVDYAPAEEFHAWDKVDIVLCPLEPGDGFEPCAHRPAEKFRTPIPRPRPNKKFNFGSNPQHRGTWEAQDASAQVDTRDHC